MPKCPFSPTATKLGMDIAGMDIERINAIGNTLADLSQRTEALRGYL